MNTRVESISWVITRCLLVAFAFASTAVVLALVAGSSNQANAAACAAPATDYGTATADITVTTAGTYRVWSRINSPTTGNNSYLLEIDGNQCFTVGDGNANIPINQWTWVDFQNGTTTTKIDVQLTAGSHSIKMIGREPEVKLDKVMFVSDTTCLPTGFGENCSAAGGDGTADTTAPIVELTAPQADATVSGTVQMTAQASDNPGGSGMAKVEFFVNNELKASDTSSPYAASWEVGSSPTGTYTIKVVATDKSGNTSNDSAIVKVQGSTGGGGTPGTPDTQAPTAPGNVAAVAEAHNRVKVTWAASTDNVAVKGYKVYRNNSQIADVTTGTEYVDNAVVGDTDYAYKAIAYDEIGNQSTASTTVNVKTPLPPVGGGDDDDDDTDGDGDGTGGGGQDSAPTAPGSLTGTAVSATQINLRWTASTDNNGVKEYEVYRAAGSAPATLVGVWQGTSVGSTGLQPDTEYSFYVIAKDAEGNSSQKSNIVTAKTKAASAGGLVDVDEGTTGGGNDGGGVSGNVGIIISVKIRIFIAGQQQIFRTDSNGNYDIGNLPEGKFPVTFTHPNYFMNGGWIDIEAGQVTVKNMKMFSKDVRSLVNSFWNR